MIDNLAKAALSVTGLIGKLTDRPAQIEAAPPPSPAVLERFASGEHRRDQAGWPVLQDTPLLRQRVLDFLAETELITMYSVGTAAWPMAHCMHFASVQDAQRRPILYLFTQNQTRKLVNIRQDARVAFTAFRPEKTGNPAATSLLEIRGLCTEVSDEHERHFAMLCQFNKPGYQFARLIGLDKQPALRVDVSNVIWEDRANGLPAISIDFFAETAPAPAAAPGARS